MLRYGAKVLMGLVQNSCRWKGDFSLVMLPYRRVVSLIAITYLDWGWGRELFLILCGVGVIYSYHLGGYLIYELTRSNINLLLCHFFLKLYLQWQVSYYCVLFHSTPFCIIFDSPPGTKVESISQNASFFLPTSLCLHSMVAFLFLRLAPMISLAPSFQRLNHVEIAIEI